METGLETFQRYIDGLMISVSLVQKKIFIAQHIPFSETLESNFPHENDLIEVQEGGEGIRIDEASH